MILLIVGVDVVFGLIGMFLNLCLNFLFMGMIFVEIGIFELVIVWVL